MPRQDARPNLPADDVDAAADKLHAAGKPVTIDTLREALGGGSPAAIGRALLAWRAGRAQPAEAPPAQLPAALVADLAKWAQQFAQEAGAGTRAALDQAGRDMDELLAASARLEAERDGLQAEVDGATAARAQAEAVAAGHAEEIERLNAELRNARQVAMDALVSKAKDQLAIDGKDAQLADLRGQLERNVAASAAQSDARLAAEMELVGAATARDGFAAEVKEMRAQLAASLAERTALRAELETLRARLPK
ncbi:DNA-binding protein [Massilia sp. SYSU DXS3249]